jgi:hypothetical protein
MTNTTPILSQQLNEQSFSSYPYEVRTLIIQLAALGANKETDSLIGLAEIKEQHWFKNFGDDMISALDFLAKNGIVTISVCKGPNFDQLN